MPFYYGKRSAGICVVLGSKNPHRIPSEGARLGALGWAGTIEYASGFFEPAVSHLPASPSPRNEG